MFCIVRKEKKEVKKKMKKNQFINSLVIVCSAMLCIYLTESIGRMGIIFLLLSTLLNRSSKSLIIMPSFTRSVDMRRFEQQPKCKPKCPKFKGKRRCFKCNN